VLRRPHPPLDDLRGVLVDGPVGRQQRRRGQRLVEKLPAVGLGCPDDAERGGGGGDRRHADDRAGDLVLPLVPHVHRRDGAPAEPVLGEPVAVDPHLHRVGVHELDLRRQVVDRVAGQDAPEVVPPQVERDLPRVQP
jgi:hypothetical protein